MSKTKKLSLTFLVAVAVLALFVATFGITAFASDDSVLGEVSGSVTVSATSAADKYLVGAVPAGQTAKLTIDGRVDVLGIAPANVAGTIEIVAFSDGASIKSRQKIDNKMFAIKNGDNFVGVICSAFNDENGAVAYYEYRVADDGYVAYSNGEYYQSLQAAIDGGTPDAFGITSVKMLCNITESIVVPAGKIVNFETDGYTLTNVAGSHTIVVEAGATFNGVGVGGTIDNVSHARGALVNYGTATLKSGKFTRSAEAGTTEGANGNSWYVISNEGTLTIDGATVRADGGYSSLVINNASCKAAGAVLTVNSGSVLYGGLNTIKNDEAGVLEITGGTIRNTTQCGVLNWSKAAIRGGEIIATGLQAVATGKWNDATTSTTVVTELRDGSYKGSIDITAGEGGTYLDPALQYNVISGGLFSEVPASKFFAENRGINTDELGDGGMYKVTIGTQTYLADINGSKYTSLTSALKVADGKTVTLLANVAESVSVESGSTVVVDLDGNTLTGDVAVSGNATLKNGTIIGAISGENVSVIDCALDRLCEASYLAEGIVLRKEADGLFHCVALADVVATVDHEGFY
ncbi:MAG: hypothetical protein ACI4QL_02925, partial [Candidatus Fimimonas sp.]